MSARSGSFGTGEPSPDGLRALLGAFPEDEPLDVRQHAAVDAGDHERRLVSYAVGLDERVEAFVLVPRGRPGPLPGVLAIHQDGNVRPYAHGKSEVAGLGGDPELAYGVEVCRRGYVVICPDRMGFESRSLARSPFRETFERWGLRTADGFDLTEDLYKGCLANRLLFAGRSSVGQELFELRRALDVLTTMPEVDRRRLGVIGHSAGGQYAALSMYLDPRLRVGCASCGTFLYRDVFGRRDVLRPINGFGGFVVPGMAGWGDMDDVLAGLAPRPYFEASGDEADASEAAELIGKARARYAALGAVERFEYIAYGAGHVFRADMRERAGAWLDRWLEPRA